MYHGPGVQVVALVPAAGPGAAADHGGDARHHRVVHLLRADEVDVRVDAAGGGDEPLARDDLRARADDDVDAGLHVRIAGLADAGDAPFLEADVGLDDAPVIDDERVGDDGVGDVFGDALALAHAVANHLAAAELHFFAVDSVVALHFDDELGVAEPHAIARGGAVHLGVGAAVDAGHGSFPMICASKP